MPFIKQEDRAKSIDELLEGVPGEKCFVHYRPMMRRWHANPCWKTVDQIACHFWPDPSERARMLAFLVFFNLHVMPYELKKREENGEVE